MDQIIHIQKNTISTMHNTEITPELLLEKGFKIQIIEDKTFFRKGDIGLHYDHVWVLDTFSFGLPYCTTIYDNIWEELVRLANEAGIDID